MEIEALKLTVLIFFLGLAYRLHLLGIKEKSAVLCYTGLISTIFFLYITILNILVIWSAQ